MNLPTNLELWMPVYGWEAHYEVSNQGRVRSFRRKGVTFLGERVYGGNAVNPFIGSSGYLCVNLTKVKVRKQFCIHSLVLEAFVSPMPIGMECCHFNGIRIDNALSNLKWGSKKENGMDKTRHKTSAGEKNAYAKLNNEKVKEIRNSPESLDFLADKFCVSRGAVEKAKYNVTWKHLA